MQNKISIVICHYKGNLIYRCLNSLGFFEGKVFVITSEYKGISRIKVRNEKWIYTNRNEPTYKRNLGSSLSQSEYLIFMDDDIQVRKECIERMAETLDTYQDIGMVYAHLFKTDNQNIVDTSGSYLTWNGFLNEEYDNSISSKIAPILSGKSACCMIRKNLFEKIGQFDEDFVIYGEETDLSWRVWMAGFRVIMAYDAIAYHASETKLKSREYYIQKNIHYHGCKNYITMLLKNLPPEKLYIALLNAWIWFTMACLFLFKKPKVSLWIFQGIWYNIKNFGYIWKKRQKLSSQNRRILHEFLKNPPLVYYLNRCFDYLKHELHC